MFLRTNPVGAGGIVKLTGSTASWEMSLWPCLLGIYLDDIYRYHRTHLYCRWENSPDKWSWIVCNAEKMGMGSKRYSVIALCFFTISLNFLQSWLELQSAINPLFLKLTLSGNFNTITESNESLTVCFVSILNSLYSNTNDGTKRCTDFELSDMKTQRAVHIIKQFLQITRTS